MKVLVLAGGLGSRLSEFTAEKPKALVEIGGKPILWHILSHYAHYGHTEFLIALGHKGQWIKDYFARDCSRVADLTLDCGCRSILSNGKGLSGWKVHLIDTGEDTHPGGRIRRMREHLSGEAFLMTWCDGLADVQIDKLISFHRAHGKLATVTAVPPPARFGRLILDGAQVQDFQEKQPYANEWINGAFFVLEPGIFDYLQSEDTRWEQEALPRLAAAGQLMAYRHRSFWHCMDTVSDWSVLERLWIDGKAPWKVWE